MHQEVVATIKHNQITVIAGDTGCGKRLKFDITSLLSSLLTMNDPYP